MDEVERLIQAFRAGGVMSSTASKLDVLMDLERLYDERVVFFLVQVLLDGGESPEVRSQVLKRLRSGPLIADHRFTVASALGQVVASGPSLGLRLQAALALGEFTDISGVVTTLGSQALEVRESIDLRYIAFTSLERAGPIPECVALVRQLTNDELLGRSAQSVLLRWRVE